MRKTLIAAAAAATALGATGIALAQSPGATMTTTVSPAKAGTVKRPKGATIKTTIVNSDAKKTAKRIDIYLPKAMRYSTKGLKFCKSATIVPSAGKSCPRTSKVGGGSASALSGVNSADPSSLTFKVTAFLTGKTTLGFLLEAHELPGFNLLAHAKVTKASGLYGSKLSVTVPPEAQQLPKGTFNGLLSLTTSLGRRNLLTTVGCKGKKQPFKSVIAFTPNPAPPVPGSVTATSAAPCS